MGEAQKVSGAGMVMSAGIASTKAMYMVDLKARCGLLTHRQYKNMLKYLTGEFSSIGFSMLYDLRKTAVADVSKIYSKDFCKKHQILIDG